MSSINLNNYEAYLLDHLEGNLSPQDTLALRAFVILHPELNIDLDEELVCLKNENIPFANKQNLKANFDDALVIGYLENVLTNKEKQKARELENTNVVFKQELEFYKKTIASPDDEIVFENKALLKRQPKVIVLSPAFFYRIAAAILLLAGIWVVVSPLVVSDRIIAPEVAANTKPLIPLNPNPVKETEYTQQNLSEKPAPHSLSPKKDEAIAIGTPSEKANQHFHSVTKEEREPLASNEASSDQEKSEALTDKITPKISEFAAEEKTAQTYIIEEGTDDEVATAAAQPKKNKLFSIASRALKKLNHNGVASVNGSANDNELVIGALSISKKL